MEYDVLSQPVYHTGMTVSILCFPSHLLYCIYCRFVLLSLARVVRFLNLPNILTMLRLIMIPLFVKVYYLPAPKWALVVFLLASATDYLDGYLARKWNQVTSFGKLMDPLADKVMLLTVLFCLSETQPDYLPKWVFYTMLIKEGMMVLGSLFMLGKKVVVMANWYGKVATIAFIVAVFAIFPWHDLVWLKELGRVLIYVAMGLSILAMFNYAYKAFIVKKT